MSDLNQIIPLTERMFTFLEDGEWTKANEYCERILDMDPKNPKAYLGKAMIKYHLHHISDISTCKKDICQF